MYLSNVYENSRWENHGTSVIVGIHDRIWMNTVDGRNIQTLSIRYNPLAPKVQCECNLRCVSPNGLDERNQPPNITFANTCAETLRFGGAGVQQSVCCRVWIFCPSTVSLSDVFTSLGVSWYPNFYCVNTLLHAADLIPNCAKHYLFTGQCNLSVSRPIFFFSLMCNCLQTALGITFWQVNATCVSAVPFFIFPTHAKMRNTLPFERYKLHASLVPFFLFLHSQLIPKCSRYCLFKGKCCMCDVWAFLVFLYSLLHGGVMESPVFFQFPVSRVMEWRVFFQFHLSVSVPFRFLFQFLLRISCVFLGFVLQSFYYLETKWHVFPESVWAKGSSNSGGLFYICTSSHLHLHVYTDHLHISATSHPQICATSHIVSPHLLIFSFSHLHRSSSHLHIFTSSHLHIFTSSHLHIFTSSHLHILSLSLYLSLSLSPLSLSRALFPSPSLSLSPLSRSLSFFFFSLLRPRAVPTRRHEMATLSREMRFDRQKLW